MVEQGIVEQCIAERLWPHLCRLSRQLQLFRQMFRQLRPAEKSSPRNLLLPPRLRLSQSSRKRHPGASLCLRQDLDRYTQHRPFLWRHQRLLLSPAPRAPAAFSVGDLFSIVDDPEADQDQAGQVLALGRPRADPREHDGPCIRPEHSPPAALQDPEDGLVSGRARDLARVRGWAALRDLSRHRERRRGRSGPGRSNGVAASNIRRPRKVR